MPPRLNVTVSGAVRSPVRLKRNVPVSTPGSDASGSNAITVTTGVGGSEMVIDATVLEPRLYRTSSSSVTTTVSMPSSRPSATGVTTISRVLLPGAKLASPARNGVKSVAPSLAAEPDTV